MGSIRSVVLKVVQQTRAADWWLFHIAPLLAVAYAAIGYYAIAPSQALPGLLRLFLSMLCIAAYAHVLNDMGDVEQDIRAGKQNGMARLQSRQRWALGLGLLLAGFALWIGSGLSAGVIALLALIAGLQPIYVFPPLRLKERGLWGVVVDSLHTHALPALFIVSVFADLVASSIWQPFPVAVTVWSFFVGVRGIVYHQLIDEANDRAAGISTFVTTNGPDAARSFVKSYIFPTELASLGVLGLTICSFAPVLLLLFLVYGGLLLVMRAAGLWQVSWADPVPAHRGGYVPLLAFYRGWPAIGFVCLLVVQDWRFAPVLLLHGLVFLPELMRQTYVFEVSGRYVARGILQIARLASKQNVA